MSKPGSKYYPLFAYLHERDQDEVTLTFAQIEKILGKPLPEGARIERGWWSNRRSASPQAKAWLDAGYKVAAVDLQRRQVVFAVPAKLASRYVVERDGDTILWNAGLIKALREHMNMSQAQFARVLGVRQQTVSEWETGAYAPTRATSKHLTLVAERAGFRYGADL
ncbi:MAG: helix-turn-helix domain-containing protein [Thermoflexales bacterium]